MDNLHVFMSSGELVDYCFENNLALGLENAMRFNDFDFHYEKVADGGDMRYEDDICLYILPDDEWTDDIPIVIPFRNENNVDVTKTSNWVIFTEGEILDLLSFSQGAYSNEYFVEYQLKEIMKYFLEYVGIVTVSDLLGIIDRGFVLGDIFYEHLD